MIRTLPVSVENCFCNSSRLFRSSKEVWAKTCNPLKRKNKIAIQKYFMTFTSFTPAPWRVSQANSLAPWRLVALLKSISGCIALQLKYLNVGIHNNAGWLERTADQNFLLLIWMQKNLRSGFPILFRFLITVSGRACYIHEHCGITDIPDDRGHFPHISVLL